MSPVPIISLQRRLTLVGAIRAGGEKPERGVGRKLEAFRLTSPRRELIEQAGVLYGGPVSPWTGPNGEEWQVYTEAPELPVLVMPHYSLDQDYELWEGVTKRTRACDGIEDAISGGPCICNAEGHDVCDIYTRLVVALPELDTVLGWRLITRGANAAHELPTMMAMIESRAGGQTFVPARLRLDQRRGVKDGQVVRYVVPTIDLGTSYLQLAAGEHVAPPLPALPAAGYITAPDRRPGVEEALATVSGPATTATTTSRSSAPMRPTPPPTPIRSQPLPVDEQTPPTSPTPPAEPEPTPTEGYEERRQTMYASDAMKKKLDVLVGKLREAGHVTTEDLYLAIAMRLRNVPVGDLIEEVGGWDADGVLHYAPLREALLRPEADQLITWLVAKERKVGASAGRTARQASAGGGGSEDSVAQRVAEREGTPYNEFPAGY